MVFRSLASDSSQDYRHYYNVEDVESLQPPFCDLAFDLLLEEFRCQ